MNKLSKNYKAILIIGIVLITLGIIQLNQKDSNNGQVFIALGGLFLIISLANRKQKTDQE